MWKETQNAYGEPGVSQGGANCAALNSTPPSSPAKILDNVLLVSPCSSPDIKLMQISSLQLRLCQHFTYDTIQLMVYSSRKMSFPSGRGALGLLGPRGGRTISNS